MVPLPLDVTDSASLHRPASQAADVNLVLNNAGVLRAGAITGAATLDDVRANKEVNYFGLLQMAQASAPALITNVPASLVNVLSLLALVEISSVAGYSVSRPLRFQRHMLYVPS